MSSLSFDQKVVSLEAQNDELFVQNNVLKETLEAEVQNSQNLHSQNKIFQEELKHLKYHIALMKQALYGRKSEKTEVSSPQMSLLFNEAEACAEAQDEHSSEEVLVKRKKNAGRKPLPKDLPRERVIHELPAEERKCKCGHELTHIGEDTSEELCHRPAKLWVKEHARFKYACKCCEETIKRAAAPFRALPKCIASSGFLADMLVKKYSDHLPLYRQSQIWQRQSISLSRSTLSNWVIGCSKILQPLVSLMKKEMLKSDYLCSDETTVNVLKEEKSTNYIWLHQSGDRQNRCVIYEYNKSRSKEVVKEFLLNFRGYHQSDGYSGYDELHQKEGVTGLGCMAHARRKFMSLVKISKTRGVADEIVDIMNKLYKIEKKAYCLSAEETKSIRQSESRVLLDELYEKLQYYKDKAPPKGFLSGAINYSLNQWKKLTAYLQDGRLRIDNNDCERSIRPFVIGRKNWTFCNTEGGANASCVIYSIIETCKANKINAFNYLKYILENIHTAENEPQLLALLPFNMDLETLKQNRRA